MSSKGRSKLAETLFDGPVVICDEALICRSFWPAIDADGEVFFGHPLERHAIHSASGAERHLIQENDVVGRFVSDSLTGKVRCWKKTPICLRPGDRPVNVN